MRIIDADALKNTFKDKEGNEFTAFHFYDAIDNAPTIERLHGEWEHWGSPFTDDTIANSIVCTRCKARYVEIDGEVFNFCPNCGAKMVERGLRAEAGLIDDAADAKLDLEYFKIGNTIYTQDDDKQRWTGREENE